jgi:transcriptional regulator with XRE-family HTH domain
MAWDGVSAQLRHVRETRGISLKKLACLAGTSIATVSRYESGWTRFELYTLKKLATALGCRLEIAFRPWAGRKRCGSEIELLGRIGRFFWDRRLNQGDIRSFPDWIVGRVLQYGKVDDIRSLAEFLGRERFLGILAGIRMPPGKVERFWQTMLRLEGVSCMKKLSRPKAAISWPE